MTDMIIVGDVHGERDRLARLLDFVCDRESHVLFVGDYVNRGSDSRGVLDLLTKLRVSEPNRYTFLAGNHDLALLDYLNDADFLRFARMGGLPTLRSYLGKPYGDVHAALLAEMPCHHIDFLRSLEAFWEGDEILISHMGYDPEKPDDRSMKAMARVAHPAIFRAGAHPKKLVVCGHYHQLGGRPFHEDGLVCVDTAAELPGGRLSAFILPSGEFFQT
jgi:serine/threonine protein phosphatase 1